MFKKLFKFGKKKDDNEEIEKLNETEDTNDVAKEITEEENTNKEQKIETNIQEPITEKDKELIEESATFEIKENEKAEIEEIKQDEEDTKPEAEEEPKQDEIEKTKVIEELSQEDDKKEIKEEVNIEVKEETIEEEKISLFDRLKQGLSKAKQGITDRIDEVLKSYTKVDEELLEELEEILITADVGVNTTMDIIEQLRVKIKQKGITDPMDVRVELKAIVEEILTNDNSKLDVSHSPTIILMVGVNGVGKTTTIGKLANKYKKDGKKVLLAAGDTFRAAAIEQLEVWSSRSNVDIIKHQEGADPGAVIFDAVKAAKARNVDVLICDTAGRLHNKANLMNELGKVFKIVDREFPEAKKEVLLVVDATTGQNAVSQAKTFKEVAQITGIVLTKLDGTAKGGVVIAVKSEVDVPVKLIGVGETVEDLQDFDAKAFSDALFGK